MNNIDSKKFYEDNIQIENECQKNIKEIQKESNSFMLKSIESELFDKIKDISVYSREEEYNMLLKMKNNKNNSELKKEFVFHNLKLVVYIANKYYRKTNKVDFCDLIEEGILGLYRAIEHFDPELGYKFSTYATWWINQTISRSIKNKYSEIRIPIHLTSVMAKIKDINLHFYQINGYYPTVEEIEQKLNNAGANISINTIKNAISFMNLLDISSIDSSIKPEKDTLVRDLLPDNEEKFESPEKTIMNTVMKNEIEKLLNTLSEKEAYILRARNGFIDGKIYTLESIGKTMGVTRERIRQIESRALKKLSCQENKEKLKYFI